MKKGVITIRVQRCLGCKSCEIACAAAHSVAKDVRGMARDGERPGHRVNVEPCGRRAVPVHCNHCEEAACMAACPTGAIHREGEGEPVLVDVGRCIGCKMCVQACPFGVIVINPSGKGVLKCDQCVERLARGEDPACVAACPTGALLFAEPSEAARAKRRRAARQLVWEQSEGEPGER